MVIAKETLTDYKELYEKANKLVSEESKTDPPTEPFRSHYAAGDVLQKLQHILQEHLKSEEQALDDDDKKILNIILTYVCRDLGRIKIFTEEISCGEEFLNTSLELVDKYKSESFGIIPFLGALNELGIVQANRSEHKVAHEYFTRAESAYMEFLASGQNPLALTDVLGTPEEIEANKGINELESLYTLCCFYLAQLYGHLLEFEKSAHYCHLTLRRQLSAKSYEPIDFALNAATLSQFYIGVKRFKAARHHLAAATLIMAEHEATMLKPEMSEQQRNDVTETFNHRYADVARCWAKYGLALLAVSQERLYEDNDNLTEEESNKGTFKVEEKEEDYRFPELQLTAYEDRVSCDYCLVFDDAKLIFHFVMNWLDKAKDYYKPETEATEYAKIIHDYAELYQHIAFFEEDPLNQIKMQKRRIKYYEDLLELLNPVFYLNICRECWYGCGAAYCSVLDIRLDALNGSRTPSPKELVKINETCQKAIKQFKDFKQSYMEKDGVTLKAGLDKEETRTVLYCYFHLGRLYYKQISADPRIQLENMENSLLYYKTFTDECKKREEIAEMLRPEVGVCTEMVNLLPFKIDNLKKRLGAKNDN